MTWSSFFPARNYRFLQVNQVENPVKLARWFDERSGQRLEDSCPDPGTLHRQLLRHPSFEWGRRGWDE